MFDRLFDLLAGWIELLKFAQIVDAYERGLVLRFGKPVRVIEPGLRFHWPLGIESTMAQNVVPTTETLSAQTVTCASGETITFTLMVKWSVFDLHKFFLDVEDADSVLEDVCAALVADLACAYDWDTIRSDDFWAKAQRKARADCRKYGITLDALKFRDLAEVQTIRLMGEVQTGGMDE